jgi:hypothetical protein
VRALRRGVKSDGSPVLIMSSEDYARLTDASIGGIAGYVRRLQGASGTSAQLDCRCRRGAMCGSGLIRDAAEKIDWALPAAQPVAEGVAREHGQHVAKTCFG